MSNAQVTDSKPGARRIGWTIDETRMPVSTERMQLHSDKVTVAGGKSVTFTYID